MGLKNASGVLMYKTHHETGLVGFLLTIDSIKKIFLELIENEGAPMKYIFECSLAWKITWNFSLVPFVPRVVSTTIQQLSSLLLHTRDCY
jgi:hypothetical protein